MANATPTASHPSPPPLPAPLRLPRYADACLTHLLPDATAAVLGQEPRVVPIPVGTRAVIVLVVDGLGRRQLDAHAVVAPFLASAGDTTVDAVFPATTVNNLTSLATGVPAAVHGLAGTALGVGGRRFVPLSWTWERLVGGDDALEDIVPEALQSTPTLFDGMRPLGVRPVTVFWPGFVGTGLTRAALRGGDIRTATGLDATLTVAVAEATATPDPTVVYCHHAEVDTAGHLSGPGSDEWCAALAATDEAIARAVEALPPGVAIVVTADHGQVAIADDDLVDLGAHPELMRGVRFVAGDPRAPHLHVEDDALYDVLAAWQETFATQAVVRTREQAIAEGWFGPVPDDRDGTKTVGAGLGKVGEIVVAARDQVAWVDDGVDPAGGRMPGHHASLTPDELEVPALVLTG